MNSGNTTLCAEWISEACQKTGQVRDKNAEALSKNVTYD